MHSLIGAGIAAPSRDARHRGCTPGAERTAHRGLGGRTSSPREL